MKVVLLGTVEFTERMFEKLISLGVKLCGVITSSREETNSDFVDLTKLAAREGIPFIQVADANNTDTLSWLANLSPDYVFCFGWSQLLSVKFLAIPRRGTVGYHPSALPQNRGRHPIVWTIVLGLEETASTFFMINAGTDSGPIISQEKVVVSKKDDAGSLYSKLVEVAERQLQDFIPELEENRLLVIEQDPQVASSWRKRSPQDGEIDWRMAASSIERLVRGLNKPYPGADFLYKRRRIKLWRCSVEMDVSKDHEPGKVVDVANGRILIKAGIGAVWLEDIEPEIFPERGEYL